MSSPTVTPKVLVIGGGIVGLLIAQGLKKERIECTVFESEPSETHYRPREWGMSIQWALPLLQDFLPNELFQRIYTAAGVDPSFVPSGPGILPTFNGATGELLKNVPLQRVYRVSRRKFRKLLSEGINVQYGKVFQNVTFVTDLGVTAHFEDGSTATGTLLIGTDGAQSIVRKSLFGPEMAKALQMPYSAVNTHVRYNDAEKALFVRQCHPIFSMAIHPDGYWLWISIQDVPDKDDPTTWTFQLQATWHRKDGEDVASLANHKARAATFCEPFRSANLWIPEGTPIFENKLSYWVPTAWNNRNGRILLAGDAAHPMTFQRGQGLNHGIADAAKLVKEYREALSGKKTFQEAADSYQAEMIDRAGDEVMTSKENTEMLHNWETVANAPIIQRGGDPRDNSRAGE